MHGRRSKTYFFRCLIWTICTGTRACVVSKLLVYTRLIFCYGAWASGLIMCTMKWTSDFLLYWKHLFPIPFIMQHCMKQGRGFRNMKLKLVLWLKNVLDEASWEILFSKSHLSWLVKGQKWPKWVTTLNRLSKEALFRENSSLYALNLLLLVQTGKFTPSNFYSCFILLLTE